MRVFCVLFFAFYARWFLFDSYDEKSVSHAVSSFFLRSFVIQGQQIGNRFGGFCLRGLERVGIDV